MQGVEIFAFLTKGSGQCLLHERRDPPSFPAFNNLRIDRLCSVVASLHSGLFGTDAPFTRFKMMGFRVLALKGRLVDALMVLNDEPTACEHACLLLGSWLLTAFEREKEDAIQSAIEEVEKVFHGG